MVRNILTKVAYVIIGLAVIGLITQLTTNTASFLISVLMTLIIAVVIFAVVYNIFIKKNNNSNEMRKYRRAVKKSKLKYKQHIPIQKKSQKISNPTKQSKSRKRASHLRVIEGNKSKRKNRANFF